MQAYRLKGREPPPVGSGELGDLPSSARRPGESFSARHLNTGKP
jgi:hypothetical protein